MRHRRCEETKATSRRQASTRRAVSGALALVAACLATGAEADWIHDTDAVEASVTTDGHRLAVACTGPGELAVYYAVPADALRSEIADQEALLMVSTQTGNPKRYSSHGVSAIDGASEKRFGFRGPATMTLARQFAGAKSTISAGLALRDHGEDFSQYNPSTFTAAGSSKAIGSLLDYCGIN